jgi:hypothetical protein
MLLAPLPPPLLLLPVPVLLPVLELALLDRSAKATTLCALLAGTVSSRRMLWRPGDQCGLSKRC